LWIRDVPIKLGRGEGVLRKAVKEIVFNLGKGFVLKELLAEAIFAFQPNIFNRVLFRGIRANKRQVTGQTFSSKPSLICAKWSLIFP